VACQSWPVSIRSAPSPPAGTLLWIWTFVRTFCSSAMAPIRSRGTPAVQRQKGKGRRKTRRRHMRGQPAPSVDRQPITPRRCLAWRVRSGGSAVRGQGSDPGEETVARVRLVRTHELETQPPFPRAGPRSGKGRAASPLSRTCVHSPAISAISRRDSVRPGSSAGPLTGCGLVLARLFA